MTFPASSVDIGLPALPPRISDVETQRELAVIYRAIHALHLAITGSSGSGGSSGSIPWNNVDKVGSSIAHLASHSHLDLTNLDSTNYSHLSAADKLELIDAGDTSLHYHLADRIHARNCALHRV